MNLLKLVILSFVALLAEGASLQAQPSGSFARWGVTQQPPPDEVTENFLARAHQLFYENDFEKAKAYYSLVLAMLPDCAEAQIGLSFTDRYLGNDSLSFAEIQKAVRLDSLAGPAHWNYGELLWPWRAAKWDSPLDEEERVHLSIRHLQKAAASGHPTAVHAHISLWTAYFALCQRDRMREQLLHMQAKNYFPPAVLDFAYNQIIGLEKDAILVTSGDMDTYPTFCVQEAHGIRPDVRVVNFGLLGIPRILKCLKKSFQLSLSEEYDFTDFGGLNPYEVLRDIVVSARQQNRPVYFSITTRNDIREVFAHDLVFEGVVLKVDELRAGQGLDLEKIKSNVMSNYKMTLPDTLRPWTRNLSPATRSMETGIFYNYALLFRLIANRHLENAEAEAAAPYLEKLFAIYDLLGDESAKVELLRDWLASAPESPQPKKLARIMSQK